MRREILRLGARLALFVMVVTTLSVLYFLLTPRPAAKVAQAPPTDTPVVLQFLATSTLDAGITLRMATPLPSPTPTALPTPTVNRRVVGIVAGHWESDSGAVCDDGLQEVDINLAIAQRVVDKLNRLGFTAEVLPEFSPKLAGYRAGALISIHADSCAYDLSGFKVARVFNSAIPQQEDHLVWCISEEYHKVTGLHFHRNTVTQDMSEYHAFNEIAPDTPGAIIEAGFMSGDRDLLENHPEKVAEGIVNGITCFLGNP